MGPQSCGPSFHRASRILVNSDTVGMSRVYGQFNSEAITVGTTPVLLTGVAAGRPNVARLNVTVSSSSAIFLGGSNVSTANGYPLAANAAYTVDATGGLYAVVASGTATVNILEVF